MSPIEFLESGDDKDARGFLSSAIRVLDKGKLVELYCYYIDKDGRPHLFVSDSEDRPGMTHFFDICKQTLLDISREEASEIEE